MTTIELDIEPIDQGNGAIGIPTLTRTLLSLQKVLFQIGTMVAESSVPHERGDFKSDVRDACRLAVRSLSIGSPMHSVLELASPNQMTLFPIGQEALDKMFQLTEAVTGMATWGDVAQILPSESFRRQILSTFKSICPVDSEKVTVSISSGGAGRRFLLSESVRSRAQVFAAQVDPSDTVEERLLIGPVRKLNNNPMEFAIQCGKRELACPYNDEYEEQLIELWRSRSVASVKAVCHVVRHEDVDDDIRSIADINGVEAVDDGALVVSEVSGDSVALRFPQPLVIQPDFSENMVAFIYPPLRAFAFGDSRDDAERALRDYIVWAWLNYARAEDSELTLDAVGIRDELHRLIREEPS